MTVRAPRRALTVVAVAGYPVLAIGGGIPALAVVPAVARLR